MKKIKWLDTLRGCACLIVLCTHIIARHPTLGVYVSGCGKIGVWLFMLLSGLLLMLPVACGEKQFKCVNILSFYEKKVVRIYPAFLFALLFSMALGLLDISGVKTILLFRGTYGHLWYIPVIIAFYFSAPILLLLFSWINKRFAREKSRYITIVVLVIIILVDVFVFPFTSYPENSIEIKWYYCVFTIGMLLAVVFPLLENKSMAWMDWLVPVGVILILIKTPLAREMIGGYPPGGYLQNQYLYMSFSWSLIIIGIIGGRSVKVVLEKCVILQKIAIISYEIYLVHFFILDYINPMVYGHMRIKGIITIIASIGISFLLHWAIERGKRMAGIHKAFIATIAFVALILGGAFAIEHSANAEDDRLYVPTMISKYGEDYFINDCWQNRVIYSNSLDTSLKNWNQLTDESYIGGHTVCSDGELLVLDNTENSQVLVYRKALEGEGYIKQQVFENIDNRPHYVTYDGQRKLFYVISSYGAKIYVFKNDGGILKLSRVDELPEIAGSYVRSISVIDGYLYTVSGPMAICQYRIGDNSFSFVKQYPVPNELAGMNQITKIGEWYYITVNTDSTGSVEGTTIVRIKDLEGLENRSWEDLYETMGFVGQPYFITQFDDRYYISEVSADRGNGIRSFVIEGDSVGDVEQLYYWEDVTETSRKTHEEGYTRIIPGEKADLMVFSGQSNMTGKGESEKAPVAEHGYEFRAISDPTMLYPATEPFGIDENRLGGIDHAWDGQPRKTGGLVTSFMNAYYDATAVPVIGVSASEGNTTISQWIPGEARFEDMKQRIEDAKSYLESTSYTVRNICFVWCQGESDGDAGTSEQSYSQQFDMLVNGVAELGVNHVFVIGIGEKQGEAPNDYHEIREAQEAYCDAHANCTMVASFYGMAEYQKDDYHYTQEGYNRIGEEAGKMAALALQED